MQNHLTFERTIAVLNCINPQSIYFFNILSLRNMEYVLYD